jgi:hypothetical protein
MYLMNILKILKEEVEKFVNGKKLYYHGRSKSRPYTGKYIFITDSLGYASGYSDENKLYAYTIPFSEDKLFSIRNPKHLNELRQYIDDYTISMIFKSGGNNEEIDWAALSYIGSDEFETPEDLFEHMGFLGIKMKERAGIESIYIFDEKDLHFEGVINLNTPEMIDKIRQFYKDFTKDKNFLENVIREEIEQFNENGNHGILNKNGKKFWIGIANIYNGEIEEVHTYDEAKANDFHHSFYFSNSAQEKIQNGDAMVFWVDKNGINNEWTHGRIPTNIISTIKQQIQVV